MSWFSDLAGKAESLLNNLDEQTGAVLRSQNGAKDKKHDFILYPDGTRGQKKKANPHNIKKSGSIFETKSSFSASARSPSVRQPRSPMKQTPNNIGNSVENVRKLSPLRKAPYTLNTSPKTYASDFKDHEKIDQFGLRRRRYSFPSDLDFMNTEKLTYNMQNLEVENAMLKNELNVMNRDISDLLDRLHRTEDELKTTQIKLESSEKLNNMLNAEKESLVSQFGSNVHVSENGISELNKYKEQNEELESNISLLNDRNKELEEKIKHLTEELGSKNLAQTKLENELRHAQTTINDQQSNIEKTVAECHRLEKDWESYKLRVKSMLIAKDNQIQSMKGGAIVTEDSKMLVEQIEILKEEKESLSQAVSKVHSECDDMRRHLSQLEHQHAAAERVVSALRETLKEERLARNRAEGNCAALRKELQSLQIETNHTISNLRNSIQMKEHELNNIRESASSARTESALNVADYDVIKEADSEKIQYLTQMLVQKQEKIDALLADNNILRIQIGKIESKHRSELAALQAKFSHSIVNFQDENRTRIRNSLSSSPFSALSLRIGVIIKRFPIFRLLILIYMIGLHLWVVTVLFTSTPEDYIPKPPRL